MYALRGRRCYVADDESFMHIMRDWWYVKVLSAQIGRRCHVANRRCFFHITEDSWYKKVSRALKA